MPIGKFRSSLPLYRNDNTAIFVPHALNGLHGAVSNRFGAQAPAG
jgi:hypothetical protein